MSAHATLAALLGASLAQAPAEPTPPVEPAPPTEPAAPAEPAPPTPPAEPTPPTPPNEPSPPEPGAPPAPGSADPEESVEFSSREPDLLTSEAGAAEGAEDPEEAVSPARPHFVFINTYGLTAGIKYFPSWDSSFFFGRALRKRQTPRRWALGYQLTTSLGGAERYVYGFATLRHHLAAYTYSASGRLLAAASVGGAFFLGIQPAVLEGEGRVAYVFGRRRQERRLAGMVGGMVRLGWTYTHQELIPMPQVGAFVGFAVR